MHRTIEPNSGVRMHTRGPELGARVHLKEQMDIIRNYVSARISFFENFSE